MAKPPEEGMAGLIQNLLAKTGKSIDEWVAVAKASVLKKHRELVTLLKTDHGLTHGYAHQVAIRSLAADDAPEAGGSELIEAR